MSTTTSWGSAPAILAAASAEEDPAYYRQFTGENEKAVLTVPMRIQAAWAANDADAFVEVFTDDGSLLMGDEQLTSRARIRAFMDAAFKGSHRGARVKGWPIEVTFLTDDVVMVVTEGGIIRAGESEIRPHDLIRATWVIVKRPDGQLKLVSHQSSPIRG